MTRTRATAKDAGTRFERLIADYLAEHIDERIDRRARNGAKDRGDISGLHEPYTGKRLVVECKDVATLSLSGWVREAEIERGNDDALAGLVIHKRRGQGAPGDQYVTLTLADFVAILIGERP